MNNDSVAERVASRLKKAGCLAQFVDHDGAYSNQAELVAVGILSQAITTLTADNAAKDAEIARLKKSADAWDCLMNSMCAISALGDDQDATGDEKLNAYIDAWSKLKAQLAAVEAERDMYKTLHSHALDCVDRVFQEHSRNPDPILPDFLGLGKDKFRGVIELAEAYNALRTELTALRESAEVAKAIIKPFLNDIGGLKGKFHRGEESNERGEALLKVYDQLTADIATAALSPAAKE